MKLLLTFILTILLSLFYILLYSYYSVENVKVIQNRGKLLTILRCHNKPLEFSIKQNGKYWILNNFVRAEKSNDCHESITFTTIGDYLYVENLNYIVERWKGPVSVALYSPGKDFHATLRSIAYLRICSNPLLKKYVSFHIIFDDFPPVKRAKEMTPLLKAYKDKFECHKGAPYRYVVANSTHKARANLTFPINILRNVARENAQTHFVLPADIELLPSINIPKMFLDMVSSTEKIFQPGLSNQVFVLPLFEVAKNETPPYDKKSLVKMYKRCGVVSFHEKICRICHRIPNLPNWLNKEVEHKLNVFAIEQREKGFDHWEPFYIGTNRDPIFEERTHWEHGADKLSQNYKQCLLNYTYLVLDNAFLVHKPGIKVFDEKHPDRRVRPTEYNEERLKYEYDMLYGSKKYC